MDIETRAGKEIEAATETWLPAKEEISHYNKKITQAASQLRVEIQAMEQFARQPGELTGGNTVAQQEIKYLSDKIKTLEGHLRTKTDQYTGQIVKANVQIETLRAALRQKQDECDQSEARSKAKINVYSQSIVRLKGDAEKELTTYEQTIASLKTQLQKDRSDYLEICAQDIMQKDIVWGTPNESLRQILEKLQAQGAAYAMIGNDGMLGGIVSKSDLKEAASPYLRPEFAKLCRPLDKATIEIRVSRVMSRPVCTISPQIRLEVIMKNMTQLGLRALPVVAEDGKVLGLVTVFDILRVLLPDF